MKKILADTTSNVNHVDITGNTALSTAASVKRPDIVKILLDVPNVDPNAVREFHSSKKFRTAHENFHPTKIAVRKKIIVAIIYNTRLDKYQAVVINRRYLTRLIFQGAIPPIVSAGGGGNIEVIKLLLARKDVNRNGRDQ